MESNKTDYGTAGRRPDFSQYPDNVLLHPQSDPGQLVSLIESAGGWKSQQAIVAAHGCLQSFSWKQLRAMADAGFDIEANHCSEDAGTGETLMHRCLRIHLYDQLAPRLEKLIELGCNPHAFNGHGISVLGLLALKSKDLPSHRTRQAFDALESGGVLMTDPCADDKAFAHTSLPSDRAHEIFAHFCPDLGPWALACFEQASMKQQGSGQGLSGISRRARL